MVNRRFGAVLSAFLSIMVPTSTFAGPGDLLVSPVRVVFEGRDRVAEVTLVNKSETPAEYRIGFENRRMLENGSFEPIEIEDGETKFAENFVRFAPRRITLAPNTPQTIRLMLRKPEGLADGEYRSHLRFAAIPESGGQNSVERASGSASGLSIELIPIYGVTIPVIVRNGELDVSASFGAVDIVPDEKGRVFVETDVNRVGGKSLYGDVSLHVAGRDEPITSLRGIAVYTPNEYRKIRIEVPKSALNSGALETVELRFQQRDTGDVIATSPEFSLTQ